MKLAQRIHYFNWYNNESYSRLTQVCEKYRDAMDELTLFSGYCHHGYNKIETVEKECQILAARVADLKKRGFKSVGINVLVTLGHIDEGYTCFEQPFTAITGFDGQQSRSCICPVDQDFKEYIAEKYILYSKTHPDFIWVDDDIKLFYNGVKFGCFCPTCIKRFNQSQGTDYTRETLVAAMEVPDAISLRAAWVQDTSNKLTELFALIKTAVRSVDNTIELGFMSQHQGWSTYNGMSFDDWFTALDGCKGRPGEGFYEDSIPENVCTKALSTSRQVSEYPAIVKDLQYEVENFPYYLFQKSIRIILDECTLAVAQGMNGILLNTLKCDQNAKMDELNPLYNRIIARRSIWERMDAFAGSFHTRGFYPAISSNYDKRRPLHNGQSFFTTYDEAVNHNVMQTYTLCRVGVPLTMDKAAAAGVILTGDLADGFTDKELLEFFGRSVIMDGSALRAIERRGLGKYAGVRITGTATDGITEHFNMSDPVNKGLLDEYRDIRVAFFGGEGYTLEKLDPTVREISYLETYTGVQLGLTTTLYENSLGGRVCVLGYAAYKKIDSLSRRTQLMRICDYLTRDRMPAKILDACKAAQFIRTSEDGTKTLLSIINLSIDDTGEIHVAIYGAKHARLLEDNGKESLLTAQVDGNYGIFTLPNTAPYDMQILLAE